MSEKLNAKYPKDRDPVVGYTQAGKPVYRMSSTTFEDDQKCKRKNVLNGFYGGRKSSEAMDFGTLVHAVLEYRLERGSFPSKKAVMRMSGYYEEVKYVFMRHPHLWEDAFETAKVAWAHFGPVIDDDPDAHPNRVPEYSIDALDLTACDGRIKLGGTIDVYDPDMQAVHDWKTRSSFDFMPRSERDFRNTPQLVYFASVAALLNDWDRAFIQHLNITRPSRRNEHSVSCLPVGHWLERAYLDMFWVLLEEEIGPMYAKHMDMVREDGVAAAKHIPKNTEHCFAYNTPCIHTAYCQECESHGLTKAGYFDLINAKIEEDEAQEAEITEQYDEFKKRLALARSPVVPPDAPEPVEATPLRDRPISNLEKCTPRVCGLFAKILGVRTLGDFEQLLESGIDVVEAIPRYGVKTHDVVVASLKDFLGNEPSADVVLRELPPNHLLEGVDDERGAQ